MRSVRFWFALAAALLLVAAGHYAWFAFFGPPARWGSGVHDVRVIPGVDVPPDMRAAYRALADAREASTPQDPGSVHDVLIGASGIEGRPFHRDLATPAASDRSWHAVDVLLSHGGPSWGEDQHLYVRSRGDSSWRELHLDGGMKVQDAAVLRAGTDARILATRWHTWWPFRRSYGRFLRSVVRPALRAEYGIYALDPRGAGADFLFPGHGLVPSPDRTRTAYLTSEGGFSGYHTIMVYDAGTGERRPIVSLREADPGSGVSFGFRWAPDGHTLVIEGAASGLGPGVARTYRVVRLAYDAATGRLFDLGGMGDDR